jgi:putative endonuclease
MGQIHRYYVYILASRSRALYTGVTNDIHTRTWQHKDGRGSAFTSKYNITRLVHYEEFSDIEEAILREKSIKGWVRNRKLQLISETNPTWEDLSKDWDFRNRYEPTLGAKARAAVTLQHEACATNCKQQVLRCAQDDKSKN